MKTNNEKWISISFSEYISSKSYFEHLERVKNSYSIMNLVEHNWEHCQEVGNRAGKMAEFLGFPAVPFIVSGLWHDANHSGNTQVKDNVNIMRAMDSFWFQGRGIDNFGEDFDKLIIRLIFFTMSPRTSNNEMTKFEGIMRNSEFDPKDVEKSLVQNSNTKIYDLENLKIDREFKKWMN